MSSSENRPDKGASSSGDVPVASVSYEPPRLVAVGNLHEILAGATGSRTDGMKGLLHS
jgi:hypothetical protein